jgi:hypothetical protein
MRRVIASFVILGFAAFLALAVTPVCAVAATADDITIRNYMPSMDKLNRFLAGTKAMYAAIKADPALRAEAEASENETATDTLAQKRAHYAKHPKLFAFYQRQGLTPDDVILGMMAATNAYAAAAMPNSAAVAQLVSPAQIAWAKANQAALKNVFGELQRLEEQQAQQEQQEEQEEQPGP